ncbi:hypothetical protein [Thioalkalivibrio sulfidiphilus]|uniref:hypothetical protein n=1 Tax=Thioalkalivibrio sulfidiphilus TaxID=1033854 RepID=UPI001FE05074|nr:hypothetical protein [Thioalkalivibrio sulfidiphilus]
MFTDIHACVYPAIHSNTGFAADDYSAWMDNSQSFAKYVCGNFQTKVTTMLFEAPLDDFQVKRGQVAGSAIRQVFGFSEQANEIKDIMSESVVPSPLCQACRSQVCREVILVVIAICDWHLFLPDYQGWDKDQTWPNSNGLLLLHSCLSHTEILM